MKYVATWGRWLLIALNLRTEGMRLIILMDFASIR
jgi:hypothetical protein